MNKIVVIQNTPKMLVNLLYDFIKVTLARSGIIVYIVYQSVIPFVGIGSPQHLPRNRVCHPP